MITNVIDLLVQAAMFCMALVFMAGDQYTAGACMLITMQLTQLISVLKKKGS